MKDSSKIPLKKEKQTIEKKIFSTYRQLSTSIGSTSMDSTNCGY
jgi:hypothetical protein